MQLAVSGMHVVRVKKDILRFLIFFSGVSSEQLLAIPAWVRF